MNSRTMLIVIGSVALVVLVFWLFLTYRPSSPQEQGAMQQDQLIARGKYLVLAGGCNDCHTPKVFTAMGPVPDTTRSLSGHPAIDAVPPIPANVLTPQGWGALATGDLTAWGGPWGISYAANITSDPGTGIGSWTEEIFIKTMRSGKKMGMGRDILPPMPWQSIGQLTDGDLKAIFAYLKSTSPISNLVPTPAPPSGAPPTAR